MLDMFGHIDGCLQTHTGTRITDAGARGADGIWVPIPLVATTHQVTLQPASPKEIDSIEGGDRLKDVRRCYINDGDLYALGPRDEWTFSGLAGTYTVHAMDNRPARNYCKLLVALNDE